MVTTIAADLVRLLEAGVCLDFADPEKPVFVGVRPSHRTTLDPLLTPSQKPQTQHVLRHIVRYRQTLLTMFTATASTTTTPAIARQLWQDYAALVDDLGPRLGVLMFEHIADEYEQTTRRCALCGEPGARREHKR